MVGLPVFAADFEIDIAATMRVALVAGMPGISRHP
jgi:hypothetical protein